MAVPQNPDHFRSLLVAYALLREKLIAANLPTPVLYGSVAYLAYTADGDIEVSDIDLIASESDFARIVEACAYDDRLDCRLTDSLRIFVSGAKLSIHAESLVFPDGLDPAHLTTQEIGGNTFRCVDIATLTGIYGRSCHAAEARPEYLRKFHTLLERWLDTSHTFFLLKPSLLERSLVRPALARIREMGFSRIVEMPVRLSADDVDFLYAKEYRDLIPSIGEENSRIALENAHQFYDDRDAVLCIVRGGEGAIEEADRRKGAKYWPVQCAPGTLRYDFRDVQFDDFSFVVDGKFRCTPCDNVVHTARDRDDFLAVCERFLVR